MKRLTASVVGLVVLVTVAGVAFQACVKRVPAAVIARSARFDYGKPFYEKEDEPDAAPGQAPLGGPGDPASDAPAANPANATPVLSGPLNGMQTVDFDSYLRSLTFDRSVENGQFAESYPCELPPTGGSPRPQPCNGPMKNVSAFIEPEIGMSHMPYADIDKLTNGLIVARIIVYGRGNGRLPNLNVPIGHHAWWFVGKDNSGVLMSQIIRRSPGGAGAALRLDTLATLPFKDCSTVGGHLDVPKDSPTSARWWNCLTYKTILLRRAGAKPPVSYFTASAYGPFPDAAMLKAQDEVAVDASGWIRCGNGCCATAAQ